MNPKANNWPNRMNWDARYVRARYRQTGSSRRPTDRIGLSRSGLPLPDNLLIGFPATAFLAVGDERKVSLQ